ncbi:hypothetical protein DVP89_07925 [Yersinia enterocolitica]|nr:hypothetical protein [Yersinia enterocolitica]EKN5109217.1 hypothetical protein [Yersinia enterocolitica]EKN5155974.1 hypothetical protein [Yersinia enterocolitica]EKN6055553.1 hypothetical protein [Yersinia enterocolitica]EKN6226290.1 hypothetical protein [Yersinia enterocolitica]
MNNLFCNTGTGGATAPMGTPATYVATTHSVHFPAYQLSQGAVWRFSRRAASSDSTGYGRWH